MSGQRQESGILGNWGDGAFVVDIGLVSGEALDAGFSSTFSSLAAVAVLSAVVVVGVGGLLGFVAWGMGYNSDSQSQIMKVTWE